MKAFGLGYPHEVSVIPSLFEALLAELRSDDQLLSTAEVSADVGLSVVQ
jgi:hypothetical protein